MSPHYCKVRKIIPRVETEFESNNEINFSTEVIEKSNDENQNEELL